MLWHVAEVVPDVSEDTVAFISKAFMNTYRETQLHISDDPAKAEIILVIYA